MVLCLENLFLTEKPRFFNPKPRVAPERCMKPLSNKRSKKLKNNVMKLIRKKLVQGNSPPKSITTFTFITLKFKKHENN